MQQRRAKLHAGAMRLAAAGALAALLALGAAAPAAAQHWTDEKNFPVAVAGIHWGERVLNGLFRVTLGAWTLRFETKPVLATYDAEWGEIAFDGIVCASESVASCDCRLVYDRVDRFCELRPAKGAAGAACGPAAVLARVECPTNFVGYK